jgi:hypothetical protein
MPAVETSFPTRSLRPDGFDALGTYTIFNFLAREWKDLFSEEDFLVLKVRLPELARACALGTVDMRSLMPVEFALYPKDGTPPRRMADARRFMRPWGTQHFPATELMQAYGITKGLLGWLKAHLAAACGRKNTGADKMAVCLVVLWCLCYAHWFSFHMVRKCIGLRMTMTGLYESWGAELDLAAVGQLVCALCKRKFDSLPALEQHMTHDLRCDTLSLFKRPLRVDLRFSAMLKLTADADGKICCAYEGCPTEYADSNVRQLKLHHERHPPRIAAFAALRVENEEYERMFNATPLVSALAEYERMFNATPLVSALARFMQRHTSVSPSKRARLTHSQETPDAPNRVGPLALVHGAASHQPASPVHAPFALTGSAFEASARSVLEDNFDSAHSTFKVSAQSALGAFFDSPNSTFEASARSALETSFSSFHAALEAFVHSALGNFFNSACSGFEASARSTLEASFSSFLLHLQDLR